MWDCLEATFAEDGFGVDSGLNVWICANATAN